MPRNTEPKEELAFNAKRRVERFFNKLEKSPLSKLMEFQTNEEKKQAIVKFAQIVGIPANRLSILFNSMKKNIKDNK